MYVDIQLFWSFGLCWRFFISFFVVSMCVLCFVLFVFKVLFQFQFFVMLFSCAFYCYYFCLTGAANDTGGQRRHDRVRLALRP